MNNERKIIGEIIEFTMNYDNYVMLEKFNWENRCVEV